MDANDNPEADRVTIYTATSPNDLSKKLQGNLVKNLSPLVVTTTGVKTKEANHYVTKNQSSETGAVLIEVGFITNPEQERMLQEEEYLDQLGIVIADAIFETLYPE